jgi:hypothetical protein
MPLFATGHGYGMGVAVVMEPDRASPTLCGGGVGAVGWPGATAAGGRPTPTTTPWRSSWRTLANGIGLRVYGATTQFQGAAPSLVWVIGR